MNISRLKRVGIALALALLVLSVFRWISSTTTPDSPSSSSPSHPAASALHLSASAVQAEKERAEQEAARYQTAREQGTREKSKGDAAKAAERAKLPKECREVSEKAFGSIKEKSVFIGMSELEARCAWGTPQRVNNTVTASGTRSQWVYPGPGNYLYFRNGVLEAVQN